MKRNRLRRRSLLGLAAAMVALLTVAGCSAVKGPDTHGSYSIAISEPTHLTPGWAPGGSVYWVANALYAPLALMNKDGSLKYVHANSIKSEDGGKVWTVKIKPGWKFDNGEVITAQSYVDTMNYVAYGPNAFGQSYQLNQIEGYSDLNPAKGEPTAKKLSGLEVVDQTTFKITLSAANDDFRYNLTLVGGPFTALPSVAYKDFKAYDNAPVGSGPYKIEGSWEHNTKIRVTRNENYKGPRGQADAINYRIYSAPDPAYTDLQAGQVDIIGGSLPIPTGRLGQLQQDFGADHILTTATNTVDWLSMPFYDPRFKDPRVRQALSMALDRNAINKAIYAGLAEPATGLYPSGFVGGASKVCGEKCHYDPAAAKQLLEDAGGFKGDLALYFSSDQGQEDYLKAIANSWSQNLGINVKFETSPSSAALFEKIGQMQEMRGSFPGAWGSAVLVPSYMLNGAFKCTSQYLFTSGGYCSEKTDAAIAAASALSGKDRIAAFKAVEADVVDAFWTIPVLWRGSIYAFGHRVKNVQAIPGTPFTDVASVKPAG